jgi:peptidoglycan/LPS O-acetylase OafA/YrhL
VACAGLPAHWWLKPVPNRLTGIGKKGYSIYLTHEPLTRITGFLLLPLLPGMRPATLFALYWITSFLALVFIGVAFYHLVEAPSLAFARRFRKKGITVAPPAVPLSVPVTESRTG